MPLLETEVYRREGTSCLFYLSSVDATHVLANLRHTRWKMELVHELYCDG